MEIGLSEVLNFSVDVEQAIVSLGPNGSFAVHTLSVNWAISSGMSSISHTHLLPLILLAHALYLDIGRSCLRVI